MKQKSMRTLEPVRFDNVSIDDPFWSPRIETNRKTTIPTEYVQCKRTGQLDAWKWKPGKPKQPHIFWDSDVAKWIEAAAYDLALRPDRKLEKRVDDVVDSMAKVQMADGYLNSHYILVEPENRWTNLRDMHELYCAGHLMEAAVAYHHATGKRKFLDIMCRYADHIARTFGPKKGQKRGYPGHQEIELALVKLYRATNRRSYLNLAKFFIDERGKRPHYFDAEAKARGAAPSEYEGADYRP
ncbi:beta-L-arabinofuranosidase domain-containing protein, partial [Planctomycetota bacterium]